MSSPVNATTRQVVFSSPWCRVVSQLLPDGEPYYMVDVPDYVVVVARTADRRVALVRQHRPVVGHDSIELPSGHVEPGERADEAARRELLEEAGITASTLELLGVLVPDIGRMTNSMWCYFAPDVTLSPGHRDHREGVTSLAVDERELLAMASDGRMEHALTLSVLFLALRHGKLNPA